MEDILRAAGRRRGHHHQPLRPPGRRRPDGRRRAARGGGPELPQLRRAQPLHHRRQRAAHPGQRQPGADDHGGRRPSRRPPGRAPPDSRPADTELEEDDYGLTYRCRLPARAPARLGRRARLRLPRRRDQRHPRRLGPGREQAQVRPGPARGDGRLRGGRATPSSPAGSASAWRRPGPAPIHLLNGLYDAKLDHVPVVAIVGQTSRSAMGGSYQQEVDLLTLFKDVASEYVQMVTVPEQLPNVLDRAIRVALAERAPTAIIIPSDVQELAYSAPTHAFKMVPSRIGVDWSTTTAGRRGDRRAAEILNAGQQGRDPGRPGRPRRPQRARAGRRAARRRGRQAAARQGRALRRAARTSPARSACWEPGRATR